MTCGREPERLLRVHTWTVAHADVERERTQQVARIGNNLNQIARWANTHKGAIEASRCSTSAPCFDAKVEPRCAGNIPVLLTHHVI